MWFSSKIMETKGGPTKGPTLPSVTPLKRKKANQVPHTTIWAFKVIYLQNMNTIQIIGFDILEDFYFFTKVKISIIWFLFVDKYSWCQDN